MAGPDEVVNSSVAVAGCQEMQRLSDEGRPSVAGRSSRRRRRLPGLLQEKSQEEECEEACEWELEEEERRKKMERHDEGGHVVRCGMAEGVGI